MTGNLWNKESLHVRKLYLTFVFIILGSIFNSCELDKLSCSNCYDIKPTEGLLSIELSPLSFGDSVPVTVIKGKLETGSIILQDTIAEDYFDIWVPVGSFYTVIAEYQTDSTAIKAIDGDKVSVYLDETNCSVACWRARDGDVDCRLKKN